MGGEKGDLADCGRVLDEEGDMAFIPGPPRETGREELPAKPECCANSGCADCGEEDDGIGGGIAIG
jgi:hypothetical protein